MLANLQHARVFLGASMSRPWLKNLKLNTGLEKAMVPFNDSLCAETIADFR